MRIGRLAIPAALLSLLDLCNVGGRRFHAAVREAIGEVPAASVGRGRICSLVAAALLAAPARGAIEDTLDGAHARRFVSLDVDGDRRLTQGEYEALIDGVADRTAGLQHMTIFYEADVDGDELLTLPEYLFSRFLATEPATQKVLKQMESKLPKDFVQGIEDIFLDLRRRCSGGGARLAQALEAVSSILGVPAEYLEPEDRDKLRSLFEVADIIPDGVLNLNELDFFHFMAREALVEAALQAGDHSPDDGVAGLFARCDKNKDGGIDYEEAVDTIPKLFGETTLEEALYRDHVSDAFLWADMNRDGMIDKDEAWDFIRALSDRK